MAGPSFEPKSQSSVLLIGDSVVLGGNSYQEEDRLGPRLAQASSLDIWPVSAGSWALRNELEYLRQHPDVVTRIKFIVFVLNTGDYAEPSHWNCELTHPLVRPPYATAYVVRKYIFDPIGCGEAVTKSRVYSEVTKMELANFLRASTPHRILFMLYPNRQEARDAKLLGRVSEEQRKFLNSAGATKVFSVGSDSRWSLGLYKDNIHPTVQGNIVLAQIIADQIAGERGSSRNPK
jgi:hypothetical protein